MKVVGSPTYEVDEALHAQLAAKYSSFMPEFTEFTVGPSKFRVDKRITEKLRLATGQQVELTFRPIAVKLMKTCIKLGIPVRFTNVAVIVEDVETALHMEFEGDGEGGFWRYVFFPASQVKSPFALVAFVLLHEFCHCWLDLPVPSEPKAIYEYEFLVDVISMAAFRQVVPPHTRRHREAIKAVSHVASDEMREHLGITLQREILRNPMEYLKKVVVPPEEPSSEHLALTTSPSHEARP
jgi:hypothetical protein